MRKYRLRLFDFYEWDYFEDYIFPFKPRFYTFKKKRK